MAYTYTLKDKIFSFFGKNAKVEDTNKDANGKGIGERYQESIGEDYDEEIQSKVDDFQSNIVDPKTCLPDFIKYLEYQFGMPILLIDSDAFRRKMIAFQNTITMIKGTELCHQVLFQIIGINSVVIATVTKVSGFDSPFTFDEPGKKFDGGTVCCQHYTVTLTGSPPQTDDLNAIILRIVLYNKPINTEIESITYNSNPVPLP
jgi:hypothetical protein